MIEERDIEPAALPEQSLTEPMPRTRADVIAGLMAVVVTLLLCGMLARVVQLQARPSDELRPFISEHVNTIKIPAPRGDLQDWRGRPLSITRFGRRVFIDPTEFPLPADEAILKLADASGISATAIAKALIPKLEKNQTRQDAIDEGEVEIEVLGKPVRYVTVGRVLDDWREESVRGAKIKGVYLESRPVRELVTGPQAAGIVGKVGIDDIGLAGAEKMLDPLMHPAPGKLSYVRDASGDPMWIFPGAYEPPQRGADVRLSVDLEIQRIAHEELERGVNDADAAGGRCVVLDPLSGEVRALVDIIREPKGLVDYDWQTIIPKTGSGKRYRTLRADASRGDHPELARNRCVEDVYEPGSTFKPFMWSASTELGLAKPSEVFNTHWGEWSTPYGRHIADVVKRESMTWREVLINSSNIGMAQGTARMSFPQMRDAVVKFGFGKRTDIGLPGESPGIVTPQSRWSKFTQTSVAMGHEVAVTPIQMVRGFSIFARPGELAGTLPPVRITSAGGETMYTQGQRVLPNDIAILTRETMRGVTHNLDTRMANNASKDNEVLGLRYEAFGKSGTAEIPLGLPPPGKKKPKGSDGYFRGQYNSSFIAGAPADNPRLVVLVVIDDPGPALIAKKAHYGSATAGPVNRRIMERTLTYLGVPPTYPAGFNPATTADASNGSSAGNSSQTAAARSHAD